MNRATRASHDRLATSQHLLHTLASVLERWGEPHRRYHSLSHLEAALGAIGRFDLDDREQHLVEWAIWFHDAIYDATRSDNEAKSAQLARSALADHLDDEDLALIVNLIELTASHEVPDNDRLGAVMIDVDLSVLGAGPEVYDAYTRGVRVEYSHRPEADFNAGRLAFLDAMSSRNHLFHTTTGVELWEQRARTNMAHEADALRQALEKS